MVSTTVWKFELLGHSATCLDEYIYFCLHSKGFNNKAIYWLSVLFHLLRVCVVDLGVTDWNSLGRWFHMLVVNWVEDGCSYSMNNNNSSYWQPSSPTVPTTLPGSCCGWKVGGLGCGHWHCGCLQTSFASAPGRRKEGCRGKLSKKECFEAVYRTEAICAKIH